MTRIARRVLLGLAISGLALIWSRQTMDDALGQAPGPPKVIRPACTDNVCGGCDGRCHDPAGVEYDHLAVRRGGHCTCTPRQGGDLDRVTREAYHRWTQEVSR